MQSNPVLQLVRNLSPINHRTCLSDSRSTSYNKDSVTMIRLTQRFSFVNPLLLLIARVPSTNGPDTYSLRFRLMDNCGLGQWEYRTRLSGSKKSIVSHQCASSRCTRDTPTTQQPRRCRLRLDENLSWCCIISQKKSKCRYPTVFMINDHRNG